MKKIFLYMMMTILILSLTLAGCGGGSNGSNDDKTPPPEPKVLFSDDFERSTGEVGNHWLEMQNGAIITGLGLGKIVDDGGNKVLQVQKNGDLVNGDASWTDYCLAVKFKTSDVDNPITLKFRMDAATRNYYSVSMGSNAFLHLTKVAGSSTSTISIGKVDNYQTDTFYTLRVVVSGNNIKAYFNNQENPVIDYNDPSSPHLSGKIGLSGGNPFSSFTPDVYFDDVTVTSSRPVLYTLHWDGENSGGGGFGVSPYEVSTHFTPNDLSNCINGQIVKVKVYLKNLATSSISLIALKIYQGEATQPSNNVVCTQPVNPETLQSNSWNEITLTNPVTITNDHYWVGFRVESTGTPIGTDAGPVNSNGCWLYTGSYWTGSPGLNGNWNIRTIVSVP